MYAKTLPPSLRRALTETPVPWGPLGYLTYKRTYSRRRNDLGRTEEWGETVERCLQGLLDYGMAVTEDELVRMGEHFHQLRIMPAGRGLWQLGTSTVEKLGGASVQNCWHCPMNSLDSFVFLFDQLMLGGGVGFNVLASDVYKLPGVKGGVTVTRADRDDADFIVPDSREGWVRLLREVLDAFFVTGKSLTFSCQCIRSKGAPISGFGGVASGPEELARGMVQIAEVLSKRANKHLRPIDVLDICNIIGSVVVSGNVRRSAQIAVGHYDDRDFLNAKRWDLGNIPNWRAMSNNTVMARQTTGLPQEFWDGYEGNGEPYGLFNLDLSRRVGRLVDGDKYSDPDVTGTNPCQPAFATVLTLSGVKTFADIDAGSVIWSKEGWTNVVRKWSNGVKAVYRYRTAAGGEFVGTEDHRVLQRGEKTYVKWVDEIDTFEPISEDPEADYPSHPIPSRCTGADFLGFFEVFDITVDNDTHTYWTGGVDVSNCGEQSLCPWEGCCLVEKHLPNIRDGKQLHDAARCVYKIAKTMISLPQHWQKSREVIEKNRRIGIGVTGVCQAPHITDDLLDAVYKDLRAFDVEYSRLVGLAPSIKLTTVKPSGTVSLLPGVTPGAHPAYAPYYIRRVRMSGDDPLVSVCRAHGYHAEPVRGFDGTSDPNTMVVSVPVKTPGNALLARDLSALDQLKIQRRLQTYWSDNAVSITVYYRKEELPAIKEYLAANYENSTKSVSFLLHSEHGFHQAPYEEITKAQFEEMSASCKPITSLTDLEERDFVDNQECGKGGCPIK